MKRHGAACTGNVAGSGALVARREVSLSEPGRYILIRNM
jgi:hypothetical protein